MEKYLFADYSRESEKISVNKSVYLDVLSDHTHDFFEVVYICKGTGYHFINGTKTPTEKGDLFFLGFNSVHTFKPISQDFSWINCCFLPDAIDPELYNSQNVDDILKFAIFGNLFTHQKIRLSDIKIHGIMSQFDNLFNEMYIEYSKCATGYQEVLKNYLSILLIRIFRSINLTSNMEKSKEYQAEDIVDLVLNFFKSSSSFENIKLKDIAEKAYMSPKYFSNLFKKKTGETLTGFLLKIKIEKACIMLENTNMSIVEIMEYIGYKDTKYFYSIFAEATGETPGQYRKLKQQEKKEKLPSENN